MTKLSCGYLDPNQKYKKINANSEFDFEVTSIEARNGFVINNEYHYAGGFFLQNEYNCPDWILEEFDLDDGTMLFDEDGEAYLDIWKIKRPFRIYKRAHSNILYLVKNNDTLRFQI